MADWTFNETEYEVKEYKPLAIDDYRVRIAQVEEKTFSTGKQGWKITLDISGTNQKLFYNLVLDPSDSKMTNQKLGAFFDSFEIADRKSFGTGKQWEGKVGALRTKQREYNGAIQSEVHYFVSGTRKEKIPAWQEPTGSNKSAGAVVGTATGTDVFDSVALPDDLPF